jgi:hypothetical protein
MALSGAKPVPPATIRIGRSESSRGTKVPSGPSTRADREFLEHPVGETAARHVADVQFDLLVVLRRIGDRKRAALALGHEDVDVLPREVAQPLAARGAQEQPHHVGCDEVLGGHLHRELAAREVGHRRHLARGDGQVRERHGLAQQGFVVGAFGQRQRVGRLARIVALARHQHRLAAAAAPTEAGIGQGEPGAARTFEHGLAGFDREVPCGAGEGDGMGHG